ncbi:MAG: hypothetical protein FWB93_00110 [Oscillospiraceae bacterium]|nr:hypothetical protein [Oscillospiraceae bacterium]
MSEKKFSELFAGKRKYKEFYYEKRNKRTATKSERLVLAMFVVFVVLGLGAGIGLFHLNGEGAVTTALQRGYVYAFLSDGFDFGRMAVAFAWLLLPMVLLLAAGFSRLCAGTAVFVLFLRATLSGYGMYALFSALDSALVWQILLFASLVLLEFIILAVTLSYAQTAFFHSDYIFRNSKRLRESVVSGQFIVDALFFCGLLIILFFIRAALARLL